MAFWQTFYSVGSFLCFWINYGSGLHKKSLGEWDWKMTVMFQLLVPILIIVQVSTGMTSPSETHWLIVSKLPFMPGTPRWYIKQKNDLEKARAALRRVRDTEQDVEDEILIIREAIEYEKEIISSSYSALWKDASVRKRLGLAFVINAGQQVTGQGSLNSYSSKIYQKVFTSTTQINLINALNATVSLYPTPLGRRIH